MIKLEIEAENGKDLRNQLEAILGEYRGDSPVSITVAEPTKEEEAPKEEKTTKKRTAKKQEETKKPDFPADRNDKGESLPEEQPEEEEESSEEIALDTLIPLLVEKNRSGNKDKTKALLAKYGVERLTKLDKQHYKEFYSKLQKI